ncbi:MAG: hypothetical protein ACKOE6_09520, partial [Flammeovirgaceae bacterium]
MGTLTNILMKVFVKKFYERNTGLLAFVFYAMFGVVESNQIISYHQSLIYGVLSSTTFLLLVMLVWLLYALKFLQLIFSELAQPQNQFFVLCATLPRTTQLKGWIMALSAIYFPVLLYSFFIVWIGISQNRVWPALAVLALHIGVLLAASSWIMQRLRSLHEKKAFTFLPSVRLPWTKPFPFFYTSFLFNEIPLALLFTKLFSLFCLFGFLQIPLDHYENRVGLLGFLFGLMGHAVIVFELRKLETGRMTFLRGLPIRMLHRLLPVAFVYFLLIVPELLFLAANHLQPLDLLLTALFGVGFLIYQHHRLYRHELSMDKHLTHT